MPTTRSRSSSRNPTRREGSDEEVLSRAGSIDAKDVEEAAGGEYRRSLFVKIEECGLAKHAAE